jgi:MacB-like periplasmic core domain
LAVLGFAALIGVMTAILFGLAPALGESRAEESLSLRTGNRVTGPTFMGKVLVAGQIAMPLLLLITAGLFLATLRNLSAIDLGFESEHVLTFDLSFPKDTPAARVPRSYEQIRQRLESSPGIAAASFAWPDVYDQGGWSLGIEAEGHSSVPGEDNEAGVIATGPDFFRTLQIGLLQGRYFTDRDIANNSLVAIVNQSFADHYFPGTAAIGRRIRVPGERPQVWEIAGVVRDVRHYGARESMAHALPSSRASAGRFLDPQQR